MQSGIVGAHVVRALALLLLVPGSLYSQSPPRQGFDLQVPFTPSPVRVGDAPRLTYELHLTNFATDSLRLARVHVLHGEERSILATLEGDSLEAAVGRPGGVSAEANRLVVGPGARAVLYFSLAPESPALSGGLRHRLEYAVVGGAGGSQVVEGGATTISLAPLPELGPPLRGGPWAAVYDPSAERGHRRVFYAVEGRASIPGRFAIDWFGVDPDGRVRRSGGDRLEDFIGYGADVLAVADGVVAAARDDVSEPSTVADLPRVALADATGNYIALDVGGGRYVFYEHLQPGLRVRVGDRVRRGQVIARLGLTGQGSMPHLHLHVSDANAPLAAEGQPYLLTGFRTLGHYASIQAFVREEPWQRLAEPLSRAPSLPEPNSIVEFQR